MPDNQPSPPQRILLATDLSARCDRAFDRAVMLARQWDARLTIAHALGRNATRRQLSQPSWRRAQHEAALLAQEQIRRDLLGREVPFDLYMEEEEPVDLILRLVQELLCDFIVTGTSRSETFGRVILGSTVDRLARQADSTILVVKTRLRDAYENVLVATDFSEASAVALRRILNIFPDADFTLLHCYGAILGDASGSTAHQLAKADCDSFLQDIPAQTRDRLEILVEPGSLEHVVNTLYAERRSELLVLGSKGRSAIAHALMGGTAEQVLTSAFCDVLIVHEAALPLGT